MIAVKYAVYANDTMQIPKIDSIGFSASPEYTRYGVGQRNLYLIHFVMRGKGYFNHNPVEKGQGFLIKPYDLEEYHPDKNDPWCFLWIVSTDPSMADIFRYFHANPDTQIFDYDYIGAIESLAEQIVAKDNPALSFAELSGMFLNVLNCQLSKYEMKEDYFKFAVKYIDANIHNAISVNNLTDVLGISQPYLFRLFKAHTGKSPKQYIDDVKLKNAKRLLGETKLSINDISEILGYLDQSSFSKFFSAKTGMSPSKYRKAYAPKNK